MATLDRCRTKGVGLLVVGQQINSILRASVGRARVLLPNSESARSPTRRPDDRSIDNLTIAIFVAQFRFLISKTLSPSFFPFPTDS